MKIVRFLALYLSIAVPCTIRVFGQAQTPMVPEGKIQKLANTVYVIPDQRLNLVPNIGIIVGERGILVVDTGMGPKNADTVLREVHKISQKRVLYLTVTHFHPEHGMGAQSFPGETTIIYPIAQKLELLDKGQDYIRMFSGFSPGIADLLRPVKIVLPQVVYAQEAGVDLGDFQVQLFHWGPAHTRGDEFVYLPKQKILFAGDVVVNRFFPIMPDADANGANWIAVLDRLEKLAPTTLVPGHGAVGDAGLIRAMRDYLVYVRDHVGALKARGLSKQQVERALSPEIRNKYKDWENPEWIKNAIDNFYSDR